MHWSDATRKEDIHTKTQTQFISVEIYDHTVYITDHLEHQASINIYRYLKLILSLPFNEKACDNHQLTNEKPL